MSHHRRADQLDVAHRGPGEEGTDQRDLPGQRREQADVRQDVVRSRALHQTLDRPLLGGDNGLTASRSTNNR